MSKKLQINLDSREIKKTISQLNAFKKQLNSELKNSVSELCDIGAAEIQVAASTTVSDDDNLSRGVSTNKRIAANGTRVNAELIANGKDIAFMEFGAGIHYNGAAGSSPRPAPGIRPSFDYKIGQYGYHLGMLDSWKYTDADGQTHETHGTKASMPIYHAWKKMKEQAQSVLAKHYDFE